MESPPAASSASSDLASATPAPQPAPCSDQTATSNAHDCPAAPPPWAATTPCKWWAAGFCARGESCWYQHGSAASDNVVATSPNDGARGASLDPSPPATVTPTLNAKAETFTPSANVILPPAEADIPDGNQSPALPPTADAETEAKPSCNICYDEPHAYGLLESCSHVFCLKCIREWRQTREKDPHLVLAGTHKACPLCRQQSKFITPSTIFHVDGPEKEAAVQRYKDILAAKPCRHFEKSKNGRLGPFCPFGDECHYKHTLTDGDDRYVFGIGFEGMIARAEARHAGSASRFHLPGRRRRDMDDLQGALDELALYSYGDGPLEWVLDNGRDPREWDDPIVDLDGTGDSGDADRASGSSPPAPDANSASSSPRSQRRRAQRQYLRQQQQRGGDAARHTEYRGDDFDVDAADLSADFSEDRNGPSILFADDDDEDWEDFGQTRNIVDILRVGGVQYTMDSDGRLEYYDQDFGDPEEPAEFIGLEDFDEESEFEFFESNDQFNFM